MLIMAVAVPDAKTSLGTNCDPTMVETKERVLEVVPNCMLASPRVLQGRTEDP